MISQEQEVIIWKYLDGDCTPGELSQVREWRATPAFAAELTAAQKTHALLTDQAVVKAPDDLISLTMNRARTTQSKITVPEMSYRPLVIFGAFLAVMTVATYFLSQDAQGEGYFDQIAPYVRWADAISLPTSEYGILMIVLSLIALPMIYIMDQTLRRGMSLKMM